LTDAALGTSADAKIGLVSGFGMINYDRGLASGAAILARFRVSTPLVRPKRKNPLARTRLPLLPQGARSRTGARPDAAAAEGRFALQVCGDCRAHPLSDARRLSALPVGTADIRGCRPTRPADCRDHDSGFRTDPYFASACPWRVGTVRLDCRADHRRASSWRYDRGASASSSS